MKLTKVNIADLQPHPLNYNTHPEAQIAELVKSLDAFDQFKNIVVSNGVILAGHGLVEAAKRKGLTEVYALIRDDLTDDEQKALLVADNALPFLALPDAAALESLLADVVMEIPGVNDEWTNNIGLMRPIPFEGDGHAGASPWDRIGEKDSDFTLFKFGEIACNIQNEIYQQFLIHVQNKNVSEFVTSLIRSHLSLT